MTGKFPPVQPEIISERKKQKNIVDLLITHPSRRTFRERVRILGLSQGLEDKIISALQHSSHVRGNTRPTLSEMDEKELATEVLLARHRFTRLVFEHQAFRQAALTVVQNIYLFKQRKIFFGTPLQATEMERQEALLLFSASPEEASIPLAKTFQHLILARVWQRITQKTIDTSIHNRPFTELHNTVEQLNTLRNIYMLLSWNISHGVSRKISTIYRQSITDEDAYQIASFGVARASYRYHPSMGTRFSTYAAHWIHKEIQRQALDGRLIRISSNLVEKISQEARADSSLHGGAAYEQLCRATALLGSDEKIDRGSYCPQTAETPEHAIMQQESHRNLLHAVDTLLSPKSSDILKRRYGLGPYEGEEQSVVDIARKYGVTRGSIYQLEQVAFKKLRHHLDTEFLTCTTGS